MIIEKSCVLAGYLLKSFVISILLLQTFYPQDSKNLREIAEKKYSKIEHLVASSRFDIPVSVRGILAQNVDLNKKAEVDKFIELSSELFKIAPANDKFEVIKLKKDEIGMTHLKLQHLYKNIPVWGSELILHSNASNEIIEVNGQFTPGLSIDVTPAISSQSALEIALKDLGEAEYRWQNMEQEELLREVYHDKNRTWKPVPELSIAPENGDFNKGSYILVWKMTIAVDGAKMGNYEYFIDAVNGRIVNKFNSMPHATGTGISNYNGTVSFNTNLSGSTYQMYDTQRSIKTYTANQSENYPGTLLTDSDNYWNQNNAAVDVHWGIAKVYDFYLNVFQRNSFDNSGAEIRSSVQALAGGTINNASWTGSQMAFGDGDGTTFSNVTSLDVAAHEFTHAVTQNECGLIYQYESGALSESISDILGTTIEFYSTPGKANWYIGEECYTPGVPGDALRYMNNPNAGSQPDTYFGTYWYSGELDNGGVHTNSGVVNYAFYLLTIGGSGNDDFGDAFSVTGIGIEKSRAIAYRALTTYFSSNTDLLGARNGFLSAASDLYGSSGAEYKSVSDAFGAVGLGLRFIAKNSFNAGNIKIHGYTAASGSIFYATDGTSESLEAINQYYEPFNYLWNTSGVTGSISNWARLSPSGSLSPTGIYTSVYSFNASSTYNNYTYIAYLMKNYKIDVDHQTEFDGTQTDQSVTYIVEQNSGTITAPSTKTVGSRTYNFAGWAGSNGYSSSFSITPTDNASYTALYKLTNYASTSSGFGESSQKKLVRTNDGYLHKVYESMGYVWYEMSTDNGSTWTIMNNGRPLSEFEGKSPSIDNSGTGVAIVWQEKNGDYFTIRLAYHVFPGNTLYFGYVCDWHTIPYSHNSTPVIAYSGEQMLVAWNDSDHLVYNYCTASFYNNPVWYTSSYGEPISGTDANSLNPTVAVRKDGGTTVFHLAWQQGNTYSCAIKYCSVTPDAQHNLTFSSIETPSAGDAFNDNRNASISVVTDYPALVWEGRIYYGSEAGQTTAISRSSGGWGTSFNKYGSNVNSPTSYNGIVTWSEGTQNFTDKMFRWGSIKTLSTTGKYLQLSNGPDANSMYAVSLNNTSPYTFQTTPNVGSISKAAQAVNHSGRQGIIKKGNTEFYFTLADVSVDNEPVAFKQSPENVDVKSNTDFNSYLTTDQFNISDDSKISFSLSYGFIDSLASLSELKNDSELEFYVELVDVNSNEVIGSYEKIKFNNNNITSMNSKTYQLSTKGSGSRAVQLRIVSAVSFEGQYYFADILNDAEVLAKNNVEELAYTGSAVVTSYDLMQNYPNPFNPATTITYQLPKDGMVTLKIYDAIGTEVITLVNEYKPTGRYNVTFNASSLASGVYFYRLQVNDFTSSKKLILMK
jgi:thermolysin